MDKFNLQKQMNNDMILKYKNKIAELNSQIPQNGVSVGNIESSLRIEKALKRLNERKAEKQQMITKLNSLSKTE